MRWADHSYRRVLPDLCVPSRNLSSRTAWAPLGAVAARNKLDPALYSSQHAVGKVFGEFGRRAVYGRELCVDDWLQRAWAGRSRRLCDVCGNGGGL